MYPGDHDVEAAVRRLADRLPEPLGPLARVAYNYRWSWDADGAATLAALDPHVWSHAGGDPVAFLLDTSAATRARAAEDPDFVARVNALAARLDADLARPPHTSVVPAEHPVAFCCAEFGVHPSLPIYSGGLGVLAGDILKSASDLALPVVGVGIFYRNGYFHQRLDVEGLQHEYWIDTVPGRLPCVLVTGTDREPLKITVPVDDEDIVAQIWRVDVGRVPLYLLDTDVPENSVVGRWITGRLYEANRAIRLAQYGVLGVGGARALQAMGIEPSLYHLNEGHAALAAFELASRDVQRGVPLDEALDGVRERLVFTTHTPVAAGNETYHPDEILPMLGRVGDLIGDRDRFLASGRIHPDDPAEPPGLTVLALRSTRSANGVSRRHGEVARAMWHPLYPDCSLDDVPIGHITNGVHVPTWLRGPMRDLLDRHLGENWFRVADDPDTWAPVDDIPDAELWAARNEARAQLVQMVTQRATADRLRRGEDLGYAEAPGHEFGPDRLTIGFARRIATYKRLYLLTYDADRALNLLRGEHGLQFVFAGKAHPADTEAKGVLRQLFTLKGAPDVAGRVTFLEDYDMEVAAPLVAGCDVWVNLPRPPLEASGTSGMKSCLNGGLHLSVLDGWWAEAWDGSNGWAIEGELDDDHHAQDQRHAAALYDLLERDVVPLFFERDASGLPHRWLAMVKSSLRTNGPRFSAMRMVKDYLRDVYRPPA